MDSQMLYKTINECRVCKSTSLKDVMDLGIQCLSGRFPGANEGDPPEAPLVLAACGNCGLAQLRHSVSPGEMYTLGYGYRSGINQTMRDHLGAIAEDVSKRAALSDGDCVLDIGCNDGTLLMTYPVGVRKFGIDAVAAKFMEEYPSDLQVYDGFFDAASFKSIAGYDKAKAVTSISMFYDLEDPVKFVRDVRDILADDGIWVLEQSYIVDMLEANSFDTICHEHLEYYALRQIEYMADQNGLRVFDVSRNNVNGGSFRLYVCHKGAPYEDNTDALTQMRALEEAKCLGSNEVYIQFECRCIEQVETLRNVLEELKSNGKTVHVYGASTKGNITLQYADIDGSLVAMAADRNSEKAGRRTPKTNIPIVSEVESRALNPDYYLVLPWHFRDEFVNREQEFLKRGGKFIFPLPQFEVVSN